MTHCAPTMAYFLAFFVVGLTTASFGPAIPGFAAATGASLSEIGSIFVFHRLGYITGSLGGGSLVDRFRGNAVTGAVLFVVAAGLAAVSAAGSLAILLGSILVIGFAQGIVEVGSNTGVLRLHGDGAGPYMNGLHLSFGVGAMVSPLILALALRVFGKTSPGFLALSLLAAVAGHHIFRLPSSGTERDRGAGEEGGGSAPAVVFFALLLFLTIAGESGFAGWVYSYAIRTGLAGPGTAGLITSAFWAFLTLGRLSGIGLVRILGAGKLLLLNVAGAAAAGFLFLLFPGTVGMLWAAVALLGFSQASIVPAAFTLAGETRILTGFVAGLFVAASSTGGMIYPWLIGRFFDSRGPGVFPFFIAASQAAAFLSLLGVLLFLNRKGLAEEIP